MSRMDRGLALRDAPTIVELPVALWFSIAIAFTSGACGAQCDRHPAEPPAEFKDGVTDQRAHEYTSSSNVRDPWRGPWLDFPPGRTYRFEHHLGGVPREIIAYFAFSADPVPPGVGDTSGFVIASGNQATVQEVTPDFVDIRNDTCSDVFLMVRIADPAPESASDAGVSDASDGASP